MPSNVEKAFTAPARAMWEYKWPYMSESAAHAAAVLGWCCTCCSVPRKCSKWLCNRLTCVQTVLPSLQLHQWVSCAVRSVAATLCVCAVLLDVHCPMNAVATSPRSICMHVKLLQLLTCMAWCQTATVCTAEAAPNQVWAVSLTHFRVYIAACMHIFKNVPTSGHLIHSLIA